MPNSKTNTTAKVTVEIPVGIELYIPIAVECNADLLPDGDEIDLTPAGYAQLPEELRGKIEDAWAEAEEIQDAQVNLVSGMHMHKRDYPSTKAKFYAMGALLKEIDL